MIFRPQSKPFNLKYLTLFLFVALACVRDLLLATVIPSLEVRLSTLEKNTVQNHDIALTDLWAHQEVDSIGQKTTLQYPESNVFIYHNEHTVSLGRSPVIGVDLLQRAENIIQSYISKRGLTALSPEDWQRFVCKGDRLLRLMRLPAQEASAEMRREAESQFQSYSDLYPNGWGSYLDTNEDLSTEGLDGAFQALGASTATERNAYIRSKQTFKFQTEPNGQLHDATGATYANFYNVRDGIIGASNNFGPAQAALMMMGDENDPPPALPNLRQWSDIAFLEWQAESERKGVLLAAPHAVIRMNVVNAEFTSLVDYILTKLPASRRPPAPKGPFGAFSRIPAWPGIEFSMDEDWGKALLGSPNGAGVAWLLATHKAKFGGKCVSKATLFRGKIGPHIIFHIENVV